MIAINPIPAFDDNYFWIISNNNNAVVVDPGEARVVNEYLEKNELNLVGILITHHHADHTGGVAQLKAEHLCSIWGPASDPVKNLDHTCQQGDQVTIPLLDLSFQVISTPGHTLGHIAYFLAEGQLSPNALFCGDTLFSGGCGRIFEGTPDQMWQSIQKLMALPEDTLVFPAHEYTLSNLDFALKVEPENQALNDYYQQVKQLRATNKPTLPSKIALEKLINPFMRVESPSVIESAVKRMPESATAGADVFATIRQWKDCS